MYFFQLSNDTSYFSINEHAVPFILLWKPEFYTKMKKNMHAAWSLQVISRLPTYGNTFLGLQVKYKPKMELLPDRVGFLLSAS